MKTLRKTIKQYKRQLVGSLQRRGSDTSALEVKTKAENLELVLQREVNKDWTQTNRGNRITFVERPLLSSKDRVFTMEAALPWRSARR